MTATVETKRRKILTKALLSPATINRHAGDRSVRLGRDYFERGAVFDRRNQDGMVPGTCQGVGLAETVPHGS